MSLRLFTGIHIPPRLHERLVALQSGVPGARWVGPDNFHVTLSFIGDVEEARVADLHDVLVDVSHPSFALTLTGTGSFGSRAPRLLWAGLEPSRELEALQEKVAGRLARAGFLTETRKYSPHVTLAYLKGGKSGKELKLGPWFEASAPFLTVPFEVARFSLIESKLGTGGSHYINLQDYPLGS